MIFPITEGDDMNSSTYGYHLKKCIPRVMICFLVLGVILVGMAGIAVAEDFALGYIPLDEEIYERSIKEP
jgi:hypothetical protein